jgi:hypothetical protein
MSASSPVTDSASPYSGGAMPSDSDPNQKRIGSRAPDGDNFSLFKQTAPSDPFSSGISPLETQTFGTSGDPSGKQVDPHMTNSWSQAAPATTNVSGNVSANDGERTAPSGDYGTPQNISPTPADVLSNYESAGSDSAKNSIDTSMAGAGMDPFSSGTKNPDSAGSGYPRDIGMTNTQTQTQGPDDPFSGGGKNPGHSDAKSWAGLGPGFTPIPKANVWANLAKAGHPGGVLSVLGGLFGNQDEINNAILQNQWTQQATRDQLMMQGLTNRYDIGQQGVNARLAAIESRENIARNRPMNLSQWATNVLQNPGNYEEDDVARAQEIAAKGTQPKKDPTSVLMDPNSSPADIARAKQVLTLTHPAIATQTQTADDVQIAAQALVAALHGDPAAVSTLKDLGGFGNKKTAIFAAARKLDPTFNTSQLDRMKTTVDNYTTSTRPGGANFQLRSVNTFAQHAADLQDAVQDLGRTDSQLLNRPLSWVQQQVTSDPRMATFQTALMAPTQEYLRLLNTGGSPYETERQDMARLLPPSATVGQVIASTNEMGKVVSKRLDSLASEFKRGTNGHDLFTTIPDAISPGGRAALQKLGVTMGGGQGTSGSQYVRQGTLNGRRVGQLPNGQVVYQDTGQPAQ